MKYIVLVVFSVFLASCAHPPLQENVPGGAQVLFRNASVGYMNAMTYDDASNCENPRTIGKIFEPGDSRKHALPSEEVVTISVGAWGLPAKGGHVAWCDALFFSVKLEAEEEYTVEFRQDSQNRCGLLVTQNATGKPQEMVLRSGEGALFPGVAAEKISCTVDPRIYSL
ncbi:hypothetical protein ACJJI4_12205 [Microbulbifer sp. TRSA002]|uniref:hypothetical protein n=1 Tax=Microbulbifer sp. TRSA002 TaxID=3243382 RepID=UPI004039FEB2